MVVLCRKKGCERLQQDEINESRADENGLQSMEVMRWEGSDMLPKGCKEAQERMM